MSSDRAWQRTAHIYGNFPTTQPGFYETFNYIAHNTVNIISLENDTLMYKYLAIATADIIISHKKIKCHDMPIQRELTTLIYDS